MCFYVTTCDTPTQFFFPSLNRVTTDAVVEPAVNIRSVVTLFNTDKSSPTLYWIFSSKSYNFSGKNYITCNGGDLILHS